MKNDINPLIVSHVRYICSKLSNDELIFINIAVSSGVDPRDAPGYNKARSLFTECDDTEMHRDVLSVFKAIVQERRNGQSNTKRLSH
jgi:hypothetical protein